MDLRRLAIDALFRASRATFVARREQAALRRRLDRLLGRDDARAERERVSQADLAAGRARRGDGRRRNILFITTDQQRFDALGVNGSVPRRVAPLPVAAPT